MPLVRKHLLLVNSAELSTSQDVFSASFKLITKLLSRFQVIRSTEIKISSELQDLEVALWWAKAVRLTAPLMGRGISELTGQTAFKRLFPKKE